MALPEKPEGERLKRWAASKRSKGAREGQQLKPLGCKQPGQIIEQFSGRWQLAQAHLGGDLPTGDGAHIDRIGGIADGGVGGRRETIRLSQLPQESMGVEQQRRHHGQGQRRGCSKAASSSCCSR